MVRAISKKEKAKILWKAGINSVGALMKKRKFQNFLLRSISLSLAKVKLPKENLLVLGEVSSSFKIGEESDKKSQIRLVPTL